jgi:hypothetical protein
VNTLVCIIYFFEGEKLNTWKELITAAEFHDIGRINDWKETKHGSLSVKKIMKLIPDWQSLDMDWNLIHYLMINHCIDDHNIPYVDERYQKCLEIIKDADGLDRVRIGDLNTNYLRLNISRNLEKVAYYLLEKVYPEK